MHFYLWKVFVFYFCEDYNLYVAYFNTTAPEWTEGATDSVTLSYQRADRFEEG